MKLIYHSLASVQKHFSHYPSAEVYFSLGLETIFLGRLAFYRQVSRVCDCLSRPDGNCWRTGRISAEGPDYKGQHRLADKPPGS